MPRAEVLICCAWPRLPHGRLRQAKALDCSLGGSPVRTVNAPSLGTGQIYRDDHVAACRANAFFGLRRFAGMENTL